MKALASPSVEAKLARILTLSDATRRVSVILSGTESRDDTRANWTASPPARSFTQAFDSTSGHTRISTSGPCIFDTNTIALCPSAQVNAFPRLMAAASAQQCLDAAACRQNSLDVAVLTACDGPSKHFVAFEVGT